MKKKNRFLKFKEGETKFMQNLGVKKNFKLMLWSFQILC